MIRPGERPSDPAVHPFAAAYADLRRAVIGAGLLQRAYGYYAARGLLSFAFLVGALALPFVLPATAAGLMPAILALGFASIQVALIGHDAGHLAILRSTRANWLLGLFCWSLAVGIGFWWWYD